jgi:hypothetical protein
MAKTNKNYIHEKEELPRFGNAHYDSVQNLLSS